MKIFLQTLAVAFGMFSAVPLPQPVWNKQNMRYALCAFPLIGAVIGVIVAFAFSRVHASLKARKGRAA